MPLKIAKYCAVPSCRKTQSLHNLPSDSNTRNAWLNFVFNEVPDHVNKTLCVCSLHFAADSFANKKQFDAGFAERVRLKNGAVPSILDPTKTAQHTYIWSSKTHNNHCSHLHPSHSQMKAVVKMEVIKGDNGDIRNSEACGVKAKDTEEQIDSMNVQEESEEFNEKEKTPPIQNIHDARTGEKKGETKSQRAKAKKTITCPQCGKSFSCNSVFIVHTRRHTGEKPFTCPQCGKSFINKGNLSSHMQIHTEEKPFKCDQCEKSFKWSYSIRIHKLIHSGEKPFDCDQCDKKFVKESDLKGHRKVHTKDKPYLCSVCGKTFSWLGRFKDHQKIHAGLKEYLCSDCGKAFTTATQLKVHQRIHTGERPYKCSYCEKSFKQFGALQAHERIHTGEKPYQCHQCGKRFNCSKTTQVHSKKHCPKLNGMSVQL
ncbi:zinc finger protein 235-like [Rhinichthys klamathensis goyatoka]|uniref:zinc finger protein 235-like n=1 Tax=Rhinichthys klamathensis goyatoka TaxID=3034132 RepID=UPI0024B58DC0|nr:zinc finger protein 235-like [Rhinichthys klamathensis goyatoka]